MFNRLGHERSLNVMEDILAEEVLRDAETEERLSKIRSKVYEEYAKMDADSLNGFDIFDEANYADQTEDGYVGFAPLG